MKRKLNEDNWTSDEWMVDDNYAYNGIGDEDAYYDFLEREDEMYRDSMDLGNYPNQEQDNEYYGNLTDPQSNGRFYLAKNGEKIPYPSKVNLNERRIRRIVKESIDRYLAENLFQMDRRFKEQCEVSTSDL